MGAWEAAHSESTCRPMTSPGGSGCLLGLTPEGGHDCIPTKCVGSEVGKALGGEEQESREAVCSWKVQWAHDKKGLGTKVASVLCEEG